MEHPKEFFRSLRVEFHADGRRRGSNDAKAYIVAETLKPGTTVKSVAGKFGVGANHLSEWRRLAKDGKLVLPAPDPYETVASVVVCDAGPAGQPAMPLPAPHENKVEILFRGVTIRLDADTTALRIAEIASAVGIVE